MCLLTSISEPYQRISMHGVRASLLNVQAKSIGLSLVKMQVPEMPTMEVYENVMESMMRDLKIEGAESVAFGDIFLEDLRAYRENKFTTLNLKAIFPLWKISTVKLAREFIDLGFRAIITCVNERYLDKSFAGRMIDNDLLTDLPVDVDSCGENGEFHSFVFDGPIFKEPVLFEKGEIVYKKYVATNQSYKTVYPYGFWYCDLL